MKKLLLFICLFFSLTASQAQDVPEVQKTLVSKISADWCPPCGTWGWNLFHDIITDNDEKAVLMAVHHSGGLETPTSDAFANNFEIFGQPRFYLGNADQSVSAGNTITKRTQIQNMIETMSTQAPVANAGMIAILNGNELTVNTKTRFFQEADGEYYLGVYIIDDGHVGFQSQQGANAEHERLLRKGLSENHFGQLLMNGTISSGQEFTNSFSTTLESTWNVEKLEVATIIWKKDNDSYQFVNTNSTTNFEMATPTEELFGAYHFLLSVQPNISDSRVNVAVEMPQASSSKVDLQLFNQQGQIVKNVYSGNLSAGTHNFQINRTEVGSAGLYFLVMTNENAIKTEKIIFN